MRARLGADMHLVSSFSVSEKEFEAVKRQAGSKNIEV